MFASRAAAAAILFLISTAPALAQPAAVTISMWSFNYSPKSIHLRSGIPVTLTFVNRSDKGHNFVAGEFFATSRIIAGSAPGGGIELRGGQSRSITLVPRTGSYQAHCSHFLHAQMGMTDQIIVD